VEFYFKNKFEKLVHLVCFIVRMSLLILRIVRNGNVVHIATSVL